MFKMSSRGPFRGLLQIGKTSELTHRDPIAIHSQTCEKCHRGTLIRFVVWMGAFIRDTIAPRSKRRWSVERISPARQKTIDQACCVRGKSR